MIERLKRIILAGSFLLIFTSFQSLNAQWAMTFGGDESDTASSIQQTDDGGYIVLGETRSFGAGGNDIWVLKLSSNGDIEWQRTYGGSDNDTASSIQQTNDGGYIVAGKTGNDIWILKLNSNGDIEWQKIYEGSWYSSLNQIQQTNNGGYIIASKTWSWGAGSNDIWILKLNSNGDIEWQKTYGTSEAEDAGRIQQTSDGGYIVIGQTWSLPGWGSDTWILKLSSDGDIEWQKTYGGSGGEDVYSIQQTSDGGYIVADNPAVLKLSSAGDIEWQKIYEGIGYSSLIKIQQTSDGGYIVAGSFTFLKLSSVGELEWQKTYGVVRAYSFQQTSDNGYIVIGRTWSFDTNWGDIGIVKLSSDGGIEWQKTYGSNNSQDYPSSIQQASDEGYIVASNTHSWGAGESDIWVLKLSPNGDINPWCAFIRSSNAEVSDSDYIVKDTNKTAEDTNIIPEDTNIIPQDTDISPQDSDANVYIFGSKNCTLTLSASSGGTTDPAPGTYTYDTGTEVTLKAIPSEGYGWEWTGNVESHSNIITITMDGDKSIRAIFSMSHSDEWGDGGGGGGGGRGGGCFIATAAYSSLLHPHVRILRDFRDTYLMPNKHGRALIYFYYKYSPFVANFITKHKALKVVVRIYLLPIVAFSFMLLHLGPAITAVLHIFIFGLPFFFFWCHKRALKYK